MLNYSWKEEEARQALTEYGIEQGEEITTIKTLKSVMQKMHLTIEEAMDLCDVPTAKRERYTALI